MGQGKGEGRGLQPGSQAFGMLRWSGWVMILLVVTACGSRGEIAPSPGYERGAVPDLSGSRVMLLPTQIRIGGHPDLDQELEYAILQSGSRATWIDFGSLHSALERSPGVDIPLHDLRVDGFLVAELQRIGDPLFGDIYRLGALVNAGYALLPVEARAQRLDDGDESVEISAALLDVRTGRVLWFGVVDGVAAPPGGLVGAASAAEALARRMVR